MVDTNKSPKIKMHASRFEKLELLKKIKTCDTRILCLEKERNTYLCNKNHEFRLIYCSLEEFDVKHYDERNKRKQELQQEITRIKSGVTILQKMVSGMKPDPEFVERLKRTMESIETSVMNFKEKQRKIFESLSLEERQITQELLAFERKLDSWMNAVEPEHIGASRAMPKPTPSSMPPAVIAFERFIQQTGRLGGWSDFDHLIFLKVRGAAYNNGSLEAAERELPTKTLEEITQHEQWYVEYSTLLESKRKAIEAWREQKQTQKNINSPEQPLTAKQSVREEILTKEKEERFSKLSAWKEEQKLKILEAEEQKLKEELETSKKKGKEDKQKAILKSQVEEYAKIKEAERNEARSREEARESRKLAHIRLATKEIAMFRERDMKIMMVKKKRAEMAEMEKREKEKKLENLKEKVNMKVPHDPTRLYKLTAGWEERKKAEPEPGGSGACMSMPKRAIPSWRQGL